MTVAIRPTNLSVQGSRKDIAEAFRGAKRENEAGIVYPAGFDAERFDRATKGIVKTKDILDGFLASRRGAAGQSAVQVEEASAVELGGLSSPSSAVEGQQEAGKSWASVALKAAAGFARGGR